MLYNKTKKTLDFRKKVICNKNVPGNLESRYYCTKGTGEHSNFSSLQKNRH